VAARTNRLKTCFSSKTSAFGPNPRQRALKGDQDLEAQQMGVALSGAYMGTGKVKAKEANRRNDVRFRAN
jgi:hypothetical protein